MRRIPILLSLVIAGLIVSGAVAWAVVTTIDTTVAIDVTVWEEVETGDLFVSTRPANGAWTTNNTPLHLTALSASGKYYQGNAVRVEMGRGTPAAGERAVAGWREHHRRSGIHYLNPAELDPSLDRAPLWVYLNDDGDSGIDATIVGFVEYRAMDLRIYVASGSRVGVRYCNELPLRDSMVTALGCEGIDNTLHHLVTSMWIELYDSLINDRVTFSCVRHNASVLDTTVWACVLD